MSKKVITVFGGTGFIGRHIVYELAKSGATIRVPSRVKNRAYFLRPAGHVGQIVPMQCDTRDEDSVAAAVDGATHVVNLIGILYEKGKNTFDAVHVDTAERIAGAASKAKAGRLLHISAIGCDKGSTSKYQRSKAEGEEKVKKAFKGATIFRPGIVFGPDDGFFNMFASMAGYSPFLPAIGGGKTKFQPVYVGDIADAAAAALLGPADEVRGKTFELAGPRVYTFRELLEMTMAETGRERFIMNLPWGLAKAVGAVLSLAPDPMLTPDQVESLKTDNLPTGKLPGLSDLGVAPTALEMILPGYMDKYRSGGRFASTQKAA